MNIITVIKLRHGADAKLVFIFDAPSANTAGVLGGATPNLQWYFLCKMAKKRKMKTHGVGVHFAMLANTPKA